MKELEMNLQFFAEEGENPEAAEPDANEVEAVETEESEGESVDETEAEPEEPEEEHVQSAEENARYANIRRQAEADAKQKFEQKQAQIDTYYANLCKGKVNPETGKPILTEEDYREALAAQERVNMRTEMENAGVDPNLLDRAIMTSPVMQQAQAAIAENQQMQAQRMMQEDLNEILSFDPTMNSQDDILSQENFMDCVSYIESHPGVRLAEAYKIVNFDRLAAARTEAAKQSAINQAKSKGHLASQPGVKGNDDSVDIPEAEIAQWKEWFPEKSRKELKALYNRSIRA